MDAAEFKQQFLPYHRKLYRTAFRLTEKPSGCGRYGAGGVSEIVEQAR